MQNPVDLGVTIDEAVSFIVKALEGSKTHSLGLSKYDYIKFQAVF
jgi:hypothetical protein